MTTHPIRRIPASTLLLRIILLISALISILPSVQAQCCNAEPSSFTQPDGTVLEVHFHGNEKYTRTTTADGYTLVFDPNTKAYYYAQLAAGGDAFVSTGVLAKQNKPADLAVPKHLELNPEARRKLAMKRAAELDAVRQDSARWEALKAAKRNYHAFKNEVKKQEKAGKKGFVIPVGTIFPDSEIPSSPQMAGGDGTTDPPPPDQAPPSFTLTGNVVGLTILIDFPDEAGTVITQAQVDDYLNKPNYTGFNNAGSVYDYFFIQSGGKLRYNNTVTYYVRVPQPKSYYNDTTKDSGLCGRLILNDALDVLIANGYDFSTLTTKTGTNNIRCCNVFFAGNNSGVWAKGLWPHRWVLSPSKAVGGGKYIYDYQITNIGTTTDLKIGTFCHENGHMMLGYPDLYSYDGNAANMGNYSLMAGGNHAGSGKHPTHIDPYLKEASGWMDIVDINSSSNLRGTLQVDGDQVYRFNNPAKTTEYFLFELRDNTGYEGPYGGATGSVNPGTGVVAYHVNETGSNTYSTIFTGANPVSYTKPYEIMVIEANMPAAVPWYTDPTPDTSDAFRASGKSALSDTTTPDLKFWDATGRNTTSNCNINSISADSNIMTFNVGSGSLPATPTIVLSRATMNGYCNYGASPASQTFFISNGQGGTLNYTVSDNQTWLSCTPTTGSVTTGTAAITVNFATTGLAAGTYTGTITVTDPSASPTTKTIAVSVTIAAQPVMTLTATSISQTGITGVSGPQASFGVRNTGGGSMTYTVSATQPWLSLSPASGTVVGEIDTIYANFDATSLTPGTYTDTITVTSAQATNSPRTIPVTFTVQSADMILISPNGGEQWNKGDTKPITWTSSLGGTVKIELLKGGVVQTPAITTSTNNTGSYNWTIPSTLTAGSDYTIKITSNQQTTKSDTSNANFTILATLADALDTSGLTWTSTGNLPWFSQTTTTHDGVDAAQSGAIGDSQSSSLETTVTGPGTMTFWWKVSSETNYDYLRFYLNGVEQTGALAKISGTVDWVQKTVSIPTGSQTVKWTYSKDGSVGSGSDTAWVDQVVWTPSASPEIAVEAPLGTNLVDGSASVNCGTSMLSTPATAVTFTIKNVGASNLTGLSLSKSGTHSADFALGTLGATTVAPGGNTTFTVTFTPGGAGARTANLQIASNDSDENPFDITLNGTGITVGTLAVTPAGNLDSTGNYGGPFSPNSQIYTLSNPGNSSINWTASKTANWVSLSAASGTLAAGATTNVTVSINSNANARNVGNHTDTVSFTNITNSEGNTTRAVNLTVNPFPATATLGNLVHTYDGTAKSATVTTTPAGLANTVTYNGVATLPIAAGSYSVVATITEPNYAGTASGTLVINKASQTITFGALAPVLDTAPPFTLTGTASSGMEVAYSSSNPAVATISGSEVTIVGVGSTVITASQPGDQDYDAAADVPQTLIVGRANPLAVTTGPYKLLFGESLSLNGSGSQPSYLQTISNYDWDLNNDGTFGDVTGATPTAIPYNDLINVHGMNEGVNTIKLRVTDSSSKTHIATTTVELVVGLTWDANAGTANRTDGGGVWLDALKWWDGTTNTNWASGSSANFGNGGTGGSVTLASPTAINTLIFNPFSGTYTLGTSTSLITLNGGIIKNANSGAVTFASPITLGGAQSWTNNSTTTLTTGNGTKLIDTAGNQLTLDGSGGITIGTINQTAESITGTGDLVMNNSGLVSLGGVNANYSGNVFLNNGVLRMINNIGGLSTGNWKLNGGILDVYWGLTINRNLGSAAGEIQVTGGDSGFGMNGSNQGLTLTFNNSSSYEVVWGTEFFNPTTLMFQSQYSQSGSGVTFSNKLDLNGATRTINVHSGAAGTSRATISGQIRNSSGTAGIVKTGAGMLLISNASSAWNGSTTISEGALDFTGINLANIGGGSGRNISVADGAGVRFNALSNAILNRIAETSNEITILTGSTSNSFDFSSSTGANLPNAFLGNWASNGAKCELSGTITPAADAYRLGGKFNSGLLGIVGTNKLTGARGLIVGTSTGGGRVELAGANDFTGTTVIQSGRLTLGNNLALQNSPLDLGSTGGTFSLSDGTNAARITGSVASPSPTFGGLIGSRDLLTAFSGSSGGNNETVLVATAVTGFTLNPGAGVTCSYSGAIADFATGTTLTKTGTGKQILSGSHTYTGATTVSAGKLIINGSLSNVAAALNVDAGATLGGNGTIGRNVTIATGGLLEFNISTNAVGHSPLAISTGRDFTFSGNSTITITSSGGASPGTYTLVTGGNPITYSTLPTLSLPNGWAGEVTISGNSLQLILTSVSGSAVTLTYNVNGGTGSAPVDPSSPYSAGATATVLGNTTGMTKTGHSFAGWNTAANGSGTPRAPGSTFTINAATILYAQWTPNNYTVTFDANGGVAATPASTSVTYGSTYGTLASTTRTGYTLNGWFTAPSGGTQVTSGTSVTNASNHTLYAQWTANTYLVTLNSQGGTGGSSSVNASYQSAMPAATPPTRTGYTFGGYYTAINGGGTQYYTSAMASARNWDLLAATTLYAKWTANTYTVTFDANGGDVPIPATKSVTYDSTYGTLAITSRIGYTFTGWFTAASGGTQVTTTTTVSNASNHTLYAQWTADTYTVTFDANGGTAPAPSSKSVTYASAYGTLATTDRSGYTFNGWFTAASGGTQVNAGTTVTSTTDHTLYAQWTPLTPEMDVTRGGNPIADGGYDAVIGTAAGSATQLTFVIANNGQNTLTLQAAAKSDVDNCIVSIDSPAPATTVAQGTSTNLLVTVTPSNSGAWSFNLSIANNDPNENPYNWTVHGVPGGAITTSFQKGVSPQTSYTGVNDTYINDANTGINFGADNTMVMVYKKTGNPKYIRYGMLCFDLSSIPTNATVTSATLDFRSGSTATGTFDVCEVTGSTTWTETQPTWTNSNTRIGSTVYGTGSIPTGAAGTAVPTITLNAAGIALINSWIANPAVNYGFSLKTTSTTDIAVCSSNHATTSYRPKLTLTYTSGSQVPEMRVSRADSLVADGGTDTVNGTVPGVGAQLSYKIANLGNANMTLTTPVSAAAVSNCSIVVNTEPSSPVVASSDTNLVITVTPTAAGAWSATLSIANNDSNENPYNWTISGATVSAYAVTFDKQGGTGGDNGVAATFGSAMPAATAPSRTGYTFGGYYGGTNGTGTQYYDAAMASVTNWDVSANTTIYAKWIANTYTVNLDKQGGTGGSSSVTATFGSAMPAATVPSRTGYTFGGYYSGIGGTGTPYYTNTMASATNWNVPANTTLYAKWIANTYAVTLDLQGGTGGSTGVTATFESAMPAATPPTRIGYTFGGYFTAANGGGSQYYSDTMASTRNWDILDTATLYAKWTLSTYNVTLDKQGGTGGTASVITTYSLPMPAATAPSRSGYIFGGYFTSPNGAGSPYYTAAMTSVANWTLTADTTLYAKWTMTPYTAWITGGFSHGLSDTDPTHDPDGDNLTTLQEFAFGLDPTDPATRSMVFADGAALATPGLPITIKNGGNRLAVFSRRKDYSLAGVTYYVEFSANMNHWHRLTNPTITQHTPGASAGDYEAVSVIFPATVPVDGLGSPEQAPKFFRIGVE